MAQPRDGRHASHAQLIGDVCGLEMDGYLKEYEYSLDIKKILNKELWDMGIRMVNVHETKTRAFLLNVIFTLNSHFPF